MVIKTRRRGFSKPMVTATRVAPQTALTVEQAERLRAGLATVLAAQAAKAYALRLGYLRKRHRVVKWPCGDCAGKGCTACKGRGWRKPKSQ